jgi:hypothetical protein
MWQAILAQEAERLTNRGALRLGRQAQKVVSWVEKTGPQEGGAFAPGAAETRLNEIGDLGRHERGGFMGPKTKISLGLYCAMGQLYDEYTMLDFSCFFSGRV